MSRSGERKKCKTKVRTTKKPGVVSRMLDATIRIAVIYRRDLSDIMQTALATLKLPSVVS